MQFVSNALTAIVNKLISFGDEREEGQTLVEYALIIALVSIVLVVALGSLAGGIEGVFNDIIEAYFEISPPKIKVAA